MHAVTSGAFRSAPVVSLKQGHAMDTPCIFLVNVPGESVATHQRLVLMALLACLGDVLCIDGASRVIRWQNVMDAVTVDTTRDVGVAALVESNTVLTDAIEPILVRRDAVLQHLFLVGVARCAEFYCFALCERWLLIPDVTFEAHTPSVGRYMQVAGIPPVTAIATNAALTVHARLVLHFDVAVADGAGVGSFLESSGGLRA